MFKGLKLLSKGCKLLSKGLKHMFKGLEHKIPLGRNNFPSGRKEKFPSIEKKKHRQKNIFFFELFEIFPKFKIFILQIQIFFVPLQPF